MNIFIYLGVLTVFIPTALFFGLSKTDRNEHFFLGVHLVCACIAEIFAYYFAKTYSNNIPVYNIYALLDFICLFCYLLNLSFTKNKVSKFAKILLVLLIFSGLYETYVVNNIYSSNTIFRVSYSLLITLLAINFFNMELVNTNKIITPKNCIAIGILLFYAYFIFAHIFTSSLFSPSNILQNKVWSIVQINNIIMNVLISIAFIWMRKK